MLGSRHTVACIAGWAAVLSGKNPEYDQVQDEASELLGLSYTKSQDLFFTPNWPEPFYTQYTKARSQKQRAKIACARIDHLIETGE